MILNIQGNGMILKDKLGLKLPDFTVLTGENGSGKTQLLHYLSKNRSFRNGRKELFPITNNQATVLENIVLTYPGFNGGTTNMKFTNQSESIEIRNIRKKWDDKIQIAVRKYSLIDKSVFSNENEELDKLNFEIKESLKSQDIENNRNQKAFSKLVLEDLKILKNISFELEKRISDINFIDYIIFFQTGSVLYSSFELLFHQFYLKQKNYNHLTQDIIPPWELLNDILEKASFKYRVNYIPSLDPYQLRVVPFVDIRDNNVSIDLRGFSSGERTIINLVHIVYYLSNNKKFPDVILLDEPDAHLHPSFTKVFIDVIEEVLIERCHINIIMTTHSPSTVALAPEESVYRVDRDLGYPVKESKNIAVQKLSNGLASITFDEGNLGIQYNLKNTTKHILFTEGITDKITIEIAWEKLYGELKMPFLIQESFSASFLGNMFNQGNQEPDGVFVQFPERKLIALFDFDSAGFGNWNRKNKFPIEDETSIEKCLTRSNGENGYMLLLPVSNTNKIRNLVSKTYMQESKLTIESLFLEVPNYAEKYFKEVETIGGGKIYIFAGGIGAKRKFTEEIKKLDSKYFKEFTPLFERINRIIEK